MKFAETVAVNRGLPVTVFSSVRQAEEWLLGNDQAGAKQYAPTDEGKPHR
jgi:hypothetical protein